MTGLRTYILAALAALAFAALATPAGAATTVWAVGDGGVPEPEDDQVADFIEGAGPFDRLFYLGDVYETGTAQEFQDYYHPSYGRFKQKTVPVMGNHEWLARAEGYDPYWGSLAPQTDGGHWYSKNVGGFHVLVLNTEEPLWEGSPQFEWAKSELASQPGSCTIPLLHKPRYTASVQFTDYEDGEDQRLEPLWQELVGRAPIALTAHHHNYQRFRANRGIVQFVVGTGGRRLHPLSRGDRRLAASFAEGFGALRLKLGRERIEFEFLNSEGFRLDSGTLECKSHTTLGVARPKAGKKARRAPRRVRGRATNSETGVRLTLTGRTRKGCRSFDGKRFRRSCRGRAFKARGTAKWRFVFPRRLDWTPGRYTLKARTTGLDGVKVSRKIRFRVR